MSQAGITSDAPRCCDAFGNHVGRAARVGAQRLGVFRVAAAVVVRVAGCLGEQVSSPLENSAMTQSDGMAGPYFVDAKIGSSKITSPSTSVNRLVVAGSCGGGIVNTSWDSTAISAAKPGAIRPLR